MNPDTRTAVNLSMIRWDAVIEPNVFELNRVNTPVVDRGKGYARALMAHMLSDADACQAIIWCWIAPSGSMNYQQLAAWYMRLGFERVKLLDSEAPSFLCTIYVRWPQPNARSLQVSNKAWLNCFESREVEAAGWFFS